MLKHKLKVLLALMLIIAILAPTYVSFVSSSSGLIRINATSASIPNQQVLAGGNVSLYFGDVSWSASQQLYLLISQDADQRITPGDVVYTPIFLLSDLTSPLTVSNYATGNGAWIIGNNWINGSIASNTPVGNYYIKAFDNFNSSVATTDTYIIVYSVVSLANLQVSPSSGPGGVPVKFTGSGYPKSANVTIAYYDPTFDSWNPLTIATANASGDIEFETEIPDLKEAVGVGDYPEMYLPVSYRAEIGGVVYSYADYNQYSRGLTIVGNQIANGLFGNGTNLSSTVNVKTSDILTLSGKWFHSKSVIYIRWDSTAVVGTVTSDEWRNAVIVGTSIADSEGSFETNITIPAASAGEHYLAIEDSETRLIVKIFMSQGALQLSPSSGPGGVSLQFTGSGYPLATPVTISYYDPFFSLWTTCGSTTSDQSGHITFTTEVPDLRKALSSYDSSEVYTPISYRTEINGTVYSYADYNQYSRGLKQVGNRIANGLFGNGTDLVSAVSVETGDSLTVAGKWFHPGDAIYVRWDGKVVVGTVTSSEWNSAVIMGTSIAGSTGSFTTTATIPAADSGIHYLAVEDSETRVIVKISVSNSSAPEPTPTPTPTEEPTPTPTPAPPPLETLPNIELYCSSTTSYSGFKVQIYGAVSFNGVPASGESILLSYSKNGGKSWDDLTFTQTGSSGEFMEVWNPSVTGNYLIQAKWEGESPINAVSRIVNLAITPYSEQTLFSVASNSTITDFAFNSTSKELTFTASGPSGSTGYVRVYIPKSLINDISGLKIRVDENIVTYTSESQEDSWAIFFSYFHSTHKIVIELSAASSQGNETPPDFIVYAAIIAAVLAVPLGVVAFKRKRKASTTSTQTSDQL
jgi:hypothetical protein